MSNMNVKDGAGVDKYIKASGAGSDVDPFVVKQRMESDGPVSTALYQFADTVGDGSGTTNMGVDGSGTPVIFKVAPAAGDIYRIARIIVAVRDTGSFDSGGWGSNGGTPLTEGIYMDIVQDSVETPLIASPIQSHYDMASMCHDVIHNDWGSGDEFITFRFTFTKAGQYIRLIGDDGDSLMFTINDDLTHLVNQVISAQGYVE